MTTAPGIDGLDLRALAGYLGDRLPGFDASAPVEAEILAGGRSNLSFQLRQGDHSWVLRRPPLGHVMDSAHDVAREFRVLRGLGQVGFPVPRVDLLCADEGVLGVPFVVMEFVPGRVLTRAEETRSASPERNAAVCEDLVATLALLHDVDLDRADLRSLGRPTGFLERQVRRWAGQWATTKTRESADVDTLLDWLADRVGTVPSTPATLVHGDYRLDNLILGPDDEVAAVLDWEMATLGDPLADLAVSLVYWEESGDGLRSQVPVGGGTTTAPGCWTREQVVAAYCARRDCRPELLEFHVALACLKLGVIMESIHFRALAGMQRGVSAAGEDMGAACDALIALGLRTTRQGWASALHS